jgi:hypothetical protein
MKAGKIIALMLVLVLLGAWTYAADCNNGGRYEDMDDGTVTDCRTGLTWLKYAQCTDPLNGIMNIYGTLSWFNAMKWVRGVSHGMCGLTDGSSPGDWRLPTKTELMAMVEYAKGRYANPALTNAAGTGKSTNGDPFDDLQTNYYFWSSTTHAADASSAWSLYMYDGAMVASSKTDSYFVWPVRAGQSASFGPLTIN